MVQGSGLHWLTWRMCSPDGTDLPGRGGRRQRPEGANCPGCPRKCRTQRAGHRTGEEGEHEGQAGGWLLGARHQVLPVQLRLGLVLRWQEPWEVSQQGRHRSEGFKDPSRGASMHSLSISAPFNVGQGAQEPSIQHTHLTWCSRP